MSASCANCKRESNEKLCRYCGADVITGKGSYEELNAMEEPPEARFRRKTFHRFWGLMETIGGALLALTWWIEWPVQNRWIFTVRLGALVFGALLAGHGLIRLLSGSNVAWIGSESDDDRKK